MSLQVPHMMPHQQMIQPQAMQPQYAMTQPQPPYMQPHMQPMYYPGYGMDMVSILLWSQDNIGFSMQPQ